MSTFFTQPGEDTMIAHRLGRTAASSLRHAQSGGTQKVQCKRAQKPNPRRASNVSALHSRRKPSPYAWCGSIRTITDFEVGVKLCSPWV